MESQQAQSEAQTPAAETPQSASLRGVIGQGPNGQGPTYTICIVNDADVAADQTFTSNKALTFATLDQAIGSLQHLLDHAQSAKKQAELEAAYAAGVEAATKAQPQPENERAADPKVVTDVVAKEVESPAPEAYPAPEAEAPSAPVAAA